MREKIGERKLMVWMNQVKLEELNDERALRSRLAEINFMDSQSREVEQPIGETAALPRFQESVQTLQGFRGIRLITGMQLVFENCDSPGSPSQDLLWQNVTEIVDIARGWVLSCRYSRTFHSKEVRNHEAL